jgi:hypothetical protein
MGLLGWGVFEQNTAVMYDAVKALPPIRYYRSFYQLRRAYYVVVVQGGQRSAIDRDCDPGCLPFN